VEENHVTHIMTDGEKWMLYQVHQGTDRPTSQDGQHGGGGARAALCAGDQRRHRWIHEELWIGPVPKRSQEKATTVCDDTHLADEPEKEPERERKRVKLAWHNEANIFIEDPFQFSNFLK